MNLSLPIVHFDTPFTLLDKCTNSSTLNQTFCNFSNTLGFLCAYVLPIFGILGIPGNLISAIIFLRTKKLTRQKFYLAILCLLDALNIFWTGFMWMFLVKGLPWASNGRYYYIIVNDNESMCRFYRFSGTLTSTLAANFLLIPTIDRLLSIAMPIRFAKGHLRTAKIITIVYVVITIGANLPFYFWSGIKYINLKSHYLAFCSSTLYLASNWVIIVSKLRMMFYYIGLVPVFLIMLANLILAGLIIKALREHKRLTDGQSGGNDKVELDKISPSLVILFISTIYLIIGLIFAICTLSSVLMSHSVPHYQFWLSVIYDMLDISVVFFLIHESSNILIFLWRMPDFRHQFVQMLHENKYKDERSTCSILSLTAKNTHQSTSCL